ncbi:Tyrosine-protein kinase Src42A, partial [Trichoplax sp. H2]
MGNICGKDSAKKSEKDVQFDDLQPKNVENTKSPQVSNDYTKGSSGTTNPSNRRQNPPTNGRQSNVSDPPANQRADPPKQQQQPAPQNTAVVVALYDYQARTEEDLSFKAGDELEVQPDVINSGDRWWLALSRRSGLRGYIPCNYVAEISSLEAE